MDSKLSTRVGHQASGRQVDQGERPRCTNQVPTDQAIGQSSMPAHCPGCPLSSQGAVSQRCASRAHRCASKAQACNTSAETSAAWGHLHQLGRLCAATAVTLSLSCSEVSLLAGNHCADISERSIAGAAGTCSSYFSVIAGLCRCRQLANSQQVQCGIPAAAAAAAAKVSNSWAAWQASMQWKP